MNRKHSHSKVLRHDFDLRINANDRQHSYNALSDPHANAYFASRAAKQRLKQLKSHIKSERGWKSPEGKEMVKMIKSKIRGELPKIKLPLLEGKEREERRRQAEMAQLAKHKQYTEQMRSARIEQAELGLDASMESGVGMPSRGGSTLKKSRKNLKAYRKSIEKGKVGHEDFVSFLAKKKEKLEQTVQVSESTL